MRSAPTAPGIASGQLFASGTVSEIDAQPRLKSIYLGGSALARGQAASGRRNALNPSATRLPNAESPERRGARTKVQAGSPVSSASAAFSVGTNGPCIRLIASTIAAVALPSTNIAATRSGTRLAMPQIVPAPPSARARLMSASLPMVTRVLGAAARKARKCSKSPLLSLIPASMPP